MADAGRQRFVIGLTGREIAAVLAVLEGVTGDFRSAEKTMSRRALAMWKPLLRAQSRLKAAIGVRGDG